jgi:hypothetical protein
VDGGRWWRKKWMYLVRKMIASSRWNAEQVKRGGCELARILFASKSANE